MRILPDHWLHRDYSLRMTPAMKSIEVFYKVETSRASAKLRVEEIRKFKTEKLLFLAVAHFATRATRKRGNKARKTSIKL